MALRSAPRTQQDYSSYFLDAQGYVLSWEDGHPDAAYYHARRRLVLSFLADRAGGVLLDVGCGPAVMTDVLLARGFEYHGIDLSEQMIAEGRKRFAGHSRVHFQVGDVQALPLEEEAFDVVLCLGVLEYVPDLDRALDEIRRVLRPGGSFVFSMLNRWSPYRIAERFFHTGQPCQQFSTRYANRLLEEHHFTSRDRSYYDFNVVVPPFEGRFPGVARRLTRRLEFLQRTPLRWVGTAFAIHAQSSGGAGLF
jgi:SAM-dependent methyltransferase